LKVGERLMVWPGGELRAKGPFDISLGHGPRNCEPVLSRAPTARFIAFDKYVWGAAM